MNPADASIRRSPATETPAKSLNSADRRNGESDVFLDGGSRSVDQNKKNREYHLIGEQEPQNNSGRTFGIVSLGDTNGNYIRKQQ